MEQPHGPAPLGDDAGTEPAAPATEPGRELTPPASAPPTAVGAAASGPGPQPLLPVRRSNDGRRAGPPPGLVRAVDGVLDFLDAVGAAVRAAAGRPAG